MEIREIIDYLKSYDGRELKLMEVCGTHTAAIFKNGIRSLISPKIKLISGPGCPVCVTPTAYIDKCIEYAMMPNHVLLTFGDMMKVPGTNESLSEAKGRGAANIQLMYSPFEAVEKAQQHPELTYAVAAVGFETTAPAYALMIQEAEKKGISNIKLVTALKTAIPALHWICENQEDIDGFICPGHVSVITGSRVYDELASLYRKPFVVTGFEAEHILASLYRIVKQIEKNDGHTENLYRNAVKDDGNPKALAVMEKVFQTGPAMWRGLGIIEDSGLYLKDEYAEFDGGSFELYADMELPAGCGCADVIVGRINPDQCPMFGEKCTPLKPFGPCMVSSEGACGIWYRNVN
ncbi:MAG: hydrogenase formation protein HypD [Clostridiales bacterium]|nr:hydrogenase formation protein HypD [Clostridiales bacterium]